MKKILLLPLLILAIISCSKDSQTNEEVPLEESQTPGTFMYGLMKETFEEYAVDAEKGILFAQQNLVWHYENGEGVPRDYVVAYAWFHIAQINADDDDEAKGYEGWKFKYVTKMTSEQITKAKEISKEMVKKNPELIRTKKL